MKVLTEFSGTIIRLAAKAASEARSTLPPEPEPVVEAPAAEAAAETTEATEATAAETPAETADAPAEATADATDAAPAEEAAEKPAAPAVDSDATKAILEEAIGKETNISGDRLVRLREALEAVGSKTADVRLVRVYSDESPLQGAKTIGTHQYVVDLMPKSMKQDFGQPGKEGRGGRGGRGGGRGPRGGGGGSREEGPLDGSFSMDSIKNDRGGRRGR